MVVYIKLNLASWFIYFLSTTENSSKRSQRISLVLSPISSWLRITHIIWSETSQTQWYKQCWILHPVLEYISKPALPILTSMCLRKKDGLCVSDSGWETSERAGMKQIESDSGVQERRVAETYWKRAGLFLSWLSMREVLSEEVYLFFI